MVLSLNRWQGKIAVVTGASAGIGAALAEKLVKEGLQVVGLARRVQRVEELAEKLGNEKGKLYSRKADCSKEDDILKAFEWVSNNLGPVHILINNAGVIKQTDLTTGDTELWRQILDTNVLGLCIATREAIKIMKKNNIDGHIIHINSLGGHWIPNFPFLNVYPASKHAVTALTETLRQELNRIGSKIKSVSPGKVDTEICQSNNFLIDGKFMEIIKNMPSLKSEDVVGSVMYALSTPPHVQVHELIIMPIGQVI